MTPMDLELVKAEAELAAAQERVRVLRERLAESTQRARPTRPSVTRPDAPVDNLAVAKAERRLRGRGIEAIPEGHA